MSSLISWKPDGLQNTSSYPDDVIQVSNYRIAIIHKKTLLKDEVEEASFLSLILKVLVFRYYDLESKGILFL